MIKRTCVWIGAILLAATLMTGAGCSNKVTPGKVRANMSPELEGMAVTNQQRKNKVARVTDTNLRQLNDDWDRLWLLDQPLRLTPYPVP